MALAILRGALDFKREPWPQVSETAKSLVKQMLEPDPEKRLTAQQVLGKFYASHLPTIDFWKVLIESESVGCHCSQCCM